ncbi:hypothetical protein H671_1g1248 [Cricetulus griseus]|nr:hypothetical protein H671_1g1248 [Cricetulus griseus]
MLEQDPPEVVSFCRDSQSNCWEEVDAAVVLRPNIQERDWVKHGHGKPWEEMKRRGHRMRSGILAEAKSDVIKPSDDSETGKQSLLVSLAPDTSSGHFHKSPVISGTPP